MNKLTIQFDIIVKLGNRVLFWVNLITENEKRNLCYSRHHRGWSWDSGENEPEMSDKLRAVFHGKKGDAALNKVYEYGESVTIEA